MLFTDNPSRDVLEVEGEFAHLQRIRADNNKTSPVELLNNWCVMLKSLHVPESQLPTQQRLLQVCKKPAMASDGKSEIDFLLLDREMEQLQKAQTKTVQQIVEFVDEHLEQFMQINQKFQQIQDNIQGSQLLIKKLIPKLDAYKSSLFSPESKLQQFMGNYEKKLIQEQLAERARQEAEFLLKFVHSFENFINLNLEELSHQQKSNIVRMLRKKEYLRSLFEHPLVKAMSATSNDLCILLSNVNEELQFYLSEQLSRVVSNKALRNEKYANDVSLLDELHMWFRSMGKQDGFFQIIQESIICRKLSALELMLLAHKQALIVGNQQQSVRQFFNDLFQLAQQFPDDYPLDRIVKIIHKFLAKKELNFMYSYVVPTFPISYSAYKAAVGRIKNFDLKNELENRHGWNLKLWADLRIKTIMDRSGKDKDKSLSKWLQIVFKKSFMIHGVKNFMVKLAFLLVNRHCLKLEQETQFSSKNLDENVNILANISQMLKTKLLEAFAEELQSENEERKRTVEDQIEETIDNIKTSISNSLDRWVKLGLETVLNSCKKSLQPYRTFIVSIISRKDKQKAVINTQQNMLRPLRAYISNNTQLSERGSQFLLKLTLQVLEKYFDSEYAKEIYNHCQNNISTEQMKLVMEIVALERQTLFERVNDD